MLLMLASVCGVVQVVRGILVWDGVSLLAVALVASAALAGLLSHLADQRTTRPADRRYPR